MVKKIRLEMEKQGIPLFGCSIHPPQIGKVDLDDQTTGLGV